MIGRILLGLTCATAINLGAHAQSGWRESVANENWMHDFTVLTMYGDAWGTATDAEMGQAIARAIAKCKSLSGPELGCGASFTVIRAGWSLGIRCGRENIIVADKDFAEAERRASWREAELRAHFAPEMPECFRVVTIDPSGRSVSLELANDLSDCSQLSDMPRVITGCSKLLTRRTTPSSLVAIAYRNRSSAYAAMGNFELAESDYRDAIALDPSYRAFARSDQDGGNQPLASVELSLSEPHGRQADIELPARR